METGFRLISRYRWWLLAIIIAIWAGLAASALYGRHQSTTNPLSDLHFYQDDSLEVARQTSTGDDANRQAAKVIAAVPQGHWLATNGPSVQETVDQIVSKANKAGQTPLLVAYNIPKRDCGSFSAGGAVSAADYQDWINHLARGIGNRHAIVILEPDALPHLDCLSPTDQQQRQMTLKQAIATLKQQPDTVVYLDAGNPQWISAPEMTKRLKASGIDQADGFSVNVSNYIATADDQHFGDDISHRLDGKHFVIDTSRNGQGPSADNQWCNPLGRGLGFKPTTKTSDPQVDAYLWIKNPGTSDGNCNGAPAAGQWWAQGAEDLVAHANF